MPVTVVLAHQPRPCPNIYGARNDVDFVRQACPAQSGPNIKVWGGTWHGVTKEDNILASSDGFVRGTVEAYARHLHLVLRPEEIWFTILTQLTFYMGKTSNAERLRYLFVSHDGQKEIVIEKNSGATIYDLLVDFSGAIQKKVRTDWMREWIMPAFSTTTENDVLTANMLMMGLMQAYFKYTCGVTCGIPSITLLGDIDDWEKLVDKLDHLEDFGEEPTRYAAKLRNVLRGFLITFHDPHSLEVKDFWNNMVQAERCGTCGGPPAEADGWLFDFMYWDSTGEPRWRWSLDDLPVCYVKIPVRYFNTDQNLCLVAGGLAKRILPGAPKAYYEALNRPVPGVDLKLPVYFEPDQPYEDLPPVYEGQSQVSRPSWLRELLCLRWSRVSKKAPGKAVEGKEHTSKVVIRTLPEVKTMPKPLLSALPVFECITGSLKLPLNQGPVAPKPRCYFITATKSTSYESFESLAQRLDGRKGIIHGSDRYLSTTRQSRLMNYGLPWRAYSTVLSEEQLQTALKEELVDSIHPDPRKQGRPRKAKSTSKEIPLYKLLDDYTQGLPLRPPVEVAMAQLEGDPGKEHGTLQPLSGWMIFGDKLGRKDIEVCSSYQYGDMELEDMAQELYRSVR